MFWLWLNIAAGTIAAVTYLIWSAKWHRAGDPVLAILNAAIALACLGFSLGYALILSDVAHQPRVSREGFRLLAPVILLIPAAARFLELRRIEREEALVTVFERELDGGSE